MGVKLIVPIWVPVGDYQSGFRLGTKDNHSFKIFKCINILARKSDIIVLSFRLGVVFILTWGLKY